MMIHKYQFPSDTIRGTHEIDLPYRSNILTAQIQYGQITMWYTFPDTDVVVVTTETRKFGFYLTGCDSVPSNARYVNTFQAFGGNLIIHMFELRMSLDV